MKAKLMGMWPVVLFNIAALMFCLLLIPVTGHAKASVYDGFETSKLVTIVEFVSYAEANDVDIHEYKQLEHG